MSYLQGEVRELVKSQIRDGMTADEAADAVASLFHRAEDRWDTIDIGTISDRPGSHVLRQRWLILEIPRESAELRVELQ